MGIEEDTRKKLKQAKGRLWATQRDLSEMSEVPQPMISRLLTGKGTVGFDAVSKVLEAVGARILFPGNKDEQGGATDPLARRVETVSKTLREQGVAELEILRAVRSMLDSEIAKAQASYGTRESGASFGNAAEESAAYPAGKAKK